jgi:CRP-like cAMP-binding protein
MLVERRFDVGATVVAEGEPGRSMFIVHSGELVVSKLGDAKLWCGQPMISCLLLTFTRYINEPELTSPPRRQPN